jgi:hypothetical protein
MSTPGHTTSFVVQLQPVVYSQFDEIDDTLRSIPGVQDVVILEEAETAYLKVDRQTFDELSLAGFSFVRQGSQS